MKLFKTLNIVSLMLVAAYASAGMSSDKQKIAAIYARLDGLAMKMDVGGMAKAFQETMTTDCSFTDQTGKTLDGKQAIKQMVQQFKQFKSIPQSSTIIDSAQQKGGSMVLSVTSKMTLVLNPKTTGRPGKLGLTTKSTDTWVKVGAAWKLKSQKVTKQGVVDAGK